VMVPDRYPEFYNTLKALVEEKRIPMSRIDDAVRRILRTKLAFGLDAPVAVDPSVIESAAHADLARRAARESMVLLRNEGAALPLDGSPGAAGTIAVVGVLADPAMRAKLAELGQDIYPRDRQTPEALGALQKAEIEKWWPIIKAGNIKVE